MDEFYARYLQVPEKLRWLGAVGVCLALVAAFYLLLHTGQQEELANYGEAYNKLDADKSAKQAFADNLSRYEARHRELQQSLAVARAMLPDSADVPQFLSQLGTRARDVGLVVERVEPQPEKYQDFYAELGFEMQVRGGFHEVATFIDQAGKLDRIVNVSNISLTEPKAENQKVALKGTFSVKTYRFLTEEQAEEIAAQKAKK